MVASIFQPYIQSLCRHYAEWWTLYTLTDVEGRKVAKSDRNKRISPFDFDLMVRSINTKAPETLNQGKSEKPERQPVLKGLRDSLTDAKHVLLIGRPGSGKSTALARLLLEEAQYSQENIEETFRIPVLVELRYYQTSVIDLIRDFFRRYNLPLEAHEVETLLLKNQLLLLIDGLNELSSKEAARQDIAKLRNYRNVPMIFTTRDLSLGGDFGIEKQWEMLPLTETQMQAFIRSYLSPEQAEAMWRQLKDRTRKFAETPLLLWMLCGLFEAGEEIPRNLGEVFWIFTQTYENSSIRKHEVAALKGDVQPLGDRRLWFPALKHLASMMMQGETPVDFRTIIERGEVEREFKALFRDEPHPAKTARDCLDDLLNYHLLQIKTDNEIEFRHQLIQEYYAAEWLLDRLPELSDEQLKYYFLNYLKWTEAIGLMLGLPEVTKEQSVQLVKLSLDVDWMLGARLTGEVKPVFQEQTVEWITDLEIPELLRIELLGKTHLDIVASNLLQFLEHNDLTVRRRAIEALVKTSSEPPLEQLFRFLTDENSSISHSAAILLEKIGTKQAVEKFLQSLKDKKVHVLCHSLLALWRIGTKQAKEGWHQFINHENFNIHLLGRALRHIDDNQQVTEDLLEAVEDKDLRVDYRKIIEMSQMGTIGSPKQLIQDGEAIDIQLQCIFGEILRSTCSEQTVREFQALIPYGWVSKEDLTKIRSQHLIEGLLQALDCENSYVRSIAAEALGEIGDEQVLEQLLNCEDPHTRLIAAVALRHRSGQAVAELLQALMSQDFFARLRAKRALKAILTPQLLIQLWQVCRSSNTETAFAFISSIQERCQFYNYEIANQDPPPPPAVKQETRSENRAQTLNINSVGILNTGDVTIHGNQIGDISNG